MSKINVALTGYWREVLLSRQKEVPGIELGSALKERGITKMTAMLNIGTIKGGDGARPLRGGGAQGHDPR